MIQFVFTILVILNVMATASKLQLCFKQFQTTMENSKSLLFNININIQIEFAHIVHNVIIIQE